MAALAALMVAGAIPGGLFAPATAKADGGPVGDIIFNEPYAAPPPLSGAASMNWFVIDHPGYDSRAYTQAESEKHNVTGTPDHVVIKGGDISFYGYDVPPYVDSVFTDLYEVSSVSFVLRPIIMNFHTFSEAGFLFNGDFSYVGSKLFYTGYAVILKCGNVAGMLENSPAAANTASLCLYHIENEEWTANNFTPGNVTTTRALISVIKTGINNLDATPYKIDIDTDNATRAFDVYIDGSLRSSVSAADVEGGATGPTGFGFYTGYYAHSCHILTRIRFEDTRFAIDQTEHATSSAVHFVDALSGKDIRAPEAVNNGLSGQKYKVVQPRVIDTGVPQFLYVLSHNSRGEGIDDDLMLTYQANPLRNATTLYYALKPEGDIEEFTEKKARVNGGAWDNGSVDEPVLVTAGDSVEYRITVHKLAGRQAQPGDYGEIRDAIPNGLTIDEASITGVKSNAPVAGKITWKLEGSNRTVVWTIPAEMYPATVSVKATVDNLASWNDRIYKNTASVSIGVGYLETNATYHEFTELKVTEQFYLFDEATGLPTANKLPYPDLVTLIRDYDGFTGYEVKGLSADQARMYILKGYDIYGYQDVKLVSEIRLYDNDEYYNATIKLYYMPVYVTVHFADENGNPINSPASVKEMALPSSDYYIRNSHFSSFIFGSKQWNYYDYKLSAPSVGSNKTPGTVPVYPAAGPAFAASAMDGSKHITLFFTDKQAVKVNFKELNNPLNVLRNPMTVFFADSFDPAAAVRPPGGDGLFDDIDLTAAFGKVYQYASAYSTDGGPVKSGAPGVCSAPCEITLFFRTSYTIVEKFHKGGDSEEAGQALAPDATTSVFSGGSFKGNPPSSIYIGAERWYYMGYKVDNDSNPLNPGRPSIDSVTGDAVIIYIYEQLSTTSPGKRRPLDIPDGGPPLSPFITDHVAYIIGYPEGDVRPDRNVTRAEVATVFFRLLTDDFREEYWTRYNLFRDVAFSDWFNTAVSVMSGMEIIRGYPGGVFVPKGDITRGELAAIAARFARMMKMAGSNDVGFTDISGHWAEADINYAAVIGWVNGYPDKTYRPDQAIKRAEFMTLVNRVLGRIPETAGDLLADEMVKWPDNGTDAWYYLAVQEATNSHEYKEKDKIVPGVAANYEYWVKMTPNRDWLKLETIWQDTYAS